MSRTADLRRLADRLGIVSSYRDMMGRVRVASDDTLEALATGLGFPCDGARGPRDQLDSLEAKIASRMLEPIAVIWSDTPAAAATLRVRLPDHASGRIEWQLLLSLDDGTTDAIAGMRRTVPSRAIARIRLPRRLPLGYHRIDGTVRVGGRWHDVEQLVIVAPTTCHTLVDDLDARAMWGLVVSLYSVSSTRNWGAGDLGDLRSLVGLVADHGGAFVGINPLHAIANTGHGVSPYSPLSRVFRNPLYLDTEAMPEWRAAAEQVTVTPLSPPSSNDGPWIDYETVRSTKQSAWAECHDRFRRLREGASDHHRVSAYRAYCARHGEALESFATFMTLADRFGTDWGAWPVQLRSHDSSAVHAFRARHERGVDGHRYLQFELDRQLGQLGATARKALAIGLYGDLALGSAPGGADTWSWPELFATDVRLGAPPDDYSATGQDWGLPPVRPHALRETGHGYWISVVRSAMQHMGALRLDHVMGLFRQYWIPPGADGRSGAYVRFPADELLSIVTLESRRRGVLVVGEDLGTVPRGLTNTLRRRGILSTRVLYFERDAHGRFRPPRAYSRRAIVTATTHDHPPLAAFWSGVDLDLRADVGALDSDELPRARETRREAKDRLRRRLVAEGFPLDDEPSAGQLAAAVYGFLARTPAPLLGIALDDLAGETIPVNLPGVGMDRYRSWSRRLGVPLERLERSSIVRAVMDAVQREGRTSRRS